MAIRVIKSVKGIRIGDKVRLVYYGRVLGKVVGFSSRKTAIIVVNNAFTKLETRYSVSLKEIVKVVPEGVLPVWEVVEIC